MMQALLVKGIIKPLLLLFVLMPCSICFAADNQVVHVGVIFDGPDSRNEKLLDLVRGEIYALMAGETEVVFSDGNTAVGDWTKAGVEHETRRILDSEEVDILLGLGFLGSSVLSEIKGLSKPAIAAFVAARELQGLPYENGSSGVKNLNYIASPPSFKRDLKKFHELVPFDRATIFVTPALREAISGSDGRASGIATELKVELRTMLLGENLDEAVSGLEPTRDIALLPPLLGWEKDGFVSLVQKLNELKIPTFSLMGHYGVEQGVLAGLKPKADIARRARRIALNIQRIYLGEEAGSIPVDFPLGSKLMINMATARQVGYRPTWSTLSEAELFDSEPTEPKRKVDLISVVKEAIASNLDLAARSESVAAGFQEIAKSRSRLLPQLELGAQAVIIDRDRAKTSGGNAPERTLSGTLSLNQIIYSEAANADVDIQRSVHETRLADRSQLELDIALAAATTYLDVLLTETNLKVRRENLKLSSTNLELATIRNNIGVSGPAETYRWQSKIASDRQLVLDADAQLSIARIALNRLLHEPLEEPFAVNAEGIKGNMSLLGDERLRLRLNTPWAFAMFRDFAVREGVSYSPEMKSLNSAIEAKKRLKKSAQRASWQPTVVFNAELAHQLAEGGEGTESTSPLGSPNDTDWSVAVGAVLPLSTGGKLAADKAQANIELNRLFIERATTQEKIEQRIRTALQLAKASMASINEANLSSKAAMKNLELVKDSYGRGVASITELLDAQSASLNATLSSAASSYSALKDLMEVSRALGRFQLFTSRVERGEFLDQFEAYLINVKSNSGQ